MLLAAHVRWGASAAGRQRELADVAAWIVGRTKEAFFGEKSVLVVGDFNVGSPAVVAETTAPLGLVTPAGLGAEVKTDLAEKKRCDQILCLPSDASRFTAERARWTSIAGTIARSCRGRG